MPRFSQRIRKSRKTRKSSKQTQRKRKVTRKSNHRKHRGGYANMEINNNIQHNRQELIDRLVSLITNHQDYNDMVDYIHNEIEMPIIHPNFPIEGNNGQYTMMIYGYPHNNEDETAMLIIHIKKDENNFTEVDFDIMKGIAQEYLDELGNPELMPMNEVHSVIEQVTTETLVRA